MCAQNYLEITFLLGILHCEDVLLGEEINMQRLLEHRKLHIYTTLKKACFGLN